MVHKDQIHLGLIEKGYQGNKFYLNKTITHIQLFFFILIMYNIYFLSGH